MSNLTIEEAIHYLNRANERIASAQTILRFVTVGGLQHRFALRDIENYTRIAIKMQAIIDSAN